jgi:hypothetical protein
MNDDQRRALTTRAHAAVTIALWQQGVGRAAVDAIGDLLQLDCSESHARFFIPAFRIDLPFEATDMPNTIESVANQAAAMIADDLREEAGRRGIGELSELVAALRNEADA